MRPFDGRRVLLGVSGGIASYKSVWLARLLTQQGSEVDVVMTRAATEFVGPITFEAVTGRPVYTDLFSPGRALDHIRLAREAHAIVIAPATADLMARAAHGHADDLLTASPARSPSSRCCFIPAMNDRMWAHPQTGRNVEHLRSLGYTVVEPDVGRAGGGRREWPRSDAGARGHWRTRRAPPRAPVAARTHRRRHRRPHARSRSIRCAFSPIGAAGKMGVAIAAAAWRRGAEVHLIAGPLELPPPAGVTTTSVETTEQMCQAVASVLSAADVLIMAAAPSDFRPAHPEAAKLKKDHAPEALALEETPDILTATLERRRAGSVVVGFALETEALVANAKKKLARKRLDLIVANDATEPGAGFGTDTNRVTLLSKAGTEERLPLAPKSEVADAILDRVEALLGGR